MLRKLIGFLFLFSALNNLYSQERFITKSVAKNKLPASITYPYSHQQAVTWKQRDTAHYVILSQVDLSGHTKNAERSAYINAHHYIITHDSVKLFWKVQDGISNCEVDYHAHFIDSAFTLTDIDQDNIPEIWLMYSLACKGDVSPSALKVIMYEGSNKHAMRGTMLVQYDNVKEGGEFTFDTAFRQAPVTIRNYAKKLWNKYREEKL